MIYYFYLEILEFLILNFSIDSFNFYYKLTYFLNSLIENLKLNFLLWSFQFPILTLLCFHFDNTLLVDYIKIHLNLDSLLIGFYNIHPILLYFSFFFFFCNIYFNNNYVVNSSTNNFYLTSFTLLLGGYWGAGNSVWGYFWVNDAIEQILLLNVVIFFLQIHFFSSKQINYFSISLFISLLFYLFLLRLGLLSTRHSFFDSSNITNLIAYWIWLYIVPSFLYCIMYINFIAGWWLIGFLAFLVLYLLNQSFFNKFKLFFIHLLIFIFGFIWLKYTPHNISYGLINFSQEYYEIYIEYRNILMNNVLFLNTICLNIFFTNIYLFNILKFSSNFLIIFKYGCFCFIYFLLLL